MNHAFSSTASVIHMLLFGLILHNLLRWRICFWVSTIPAGVLAFAMMFCAESPHWLYKVCSLICVICNCKIYSLSILIVLYDYSIKALDIDSYHFFPFDSNHLILCLKINCFHVLFYVYVCCFLTFIDAIH